MLCSAAGGKDKDGLSRDGRESRDGRDRDGLGLQKIISSHVEASKIGRKIADDALDSQRPRGNGDSSSNSTPSPSRAECRSVEVGREAAGPHRRLPRRLP